MRVGVGGEAGGSTSRSVSSTKSPASTSAAATAAMHSSLAVRSTARSTRLDTRRDCSISASLACSSPAQANATSSCLEARSFLSASGTESCLLSRTASRFRPCTASRMTAVGTADCPSWPETTLPLRRAVGPALVGGEGSGRMNTGRGNELASGGPPAPSIELRALARAVLAVTAKRWARSGLLAEVI